MKIGEIMTKDVISVDEYRSITEVAKLMSDNRIHAIPVVDKENKIMGIITETDFFTKENSNSVYIPSLIDFVKSGKMNQPEGDTEELSKALEAKAGDIMSKKCETLSADMEVEDFFKLIKEKSFTSYPVANEEGVLQGIVTVADAIKLL